jgi:hypothetical protein
VDLAGVSAGDQRVEKEPEDHRQHDGDRGTPQKREHE